MLWDIVRIFAKAMTPDQSLIPPDSPGAKKWVWIDKGEVKISARVFVYHGTKIALFLLTCCTLAAPILFGSRNALSMAALYCLASFFGLLGLFSLYNAAARAVAKMMNGKGHGVENDDEEEAEGDASS